MCICTFGPISFLVGHMTQVVSHCDVFHQLGYFTLASCGMCGTACELLYFCASVSPSYIELISAIGCE